MLPAAEPSNSIFNNSDSCFPQCTGKLLAFQLLIMCSRLDLLQMKSENVTCIIVYFFASGNDAK